MTAVPPPESIQQLTKKLGLLHETLAAQKYEGIEWRGVLSQFDELLSLHVTKAVVLLENYKKEYDKDTKQAAALTRSRAQHDFMSAVGLGSPRYQSPVQTRPVPTAAPSLSSIPPPRTAMSPRHSYKMLISPGPVPSGSIPSGSGPSGYSRVAGVVSPPPLSSSSLESPKAAVTLLNGNGTPHRRGPDSPLPARVSSPMVPASSYDARSGSGYAKHSYAPVNSPAVSAPVPAAGLPIDFPPRVPSDTPEVPPRAATPQRTPAVPPAMPPQQHSLSRQSRGTTPQAPAQQAVQSTEDVLNKAGLGYASTKTAENHREYASDFAANNIVTAAQLYKQTGKDMQGLNLPTEVQTNILTLIRDYWIDLAAAHRIG